MQRMIVLLAVVACLAGCKAEGQGPARQSDGGRVLHGQSFELEPVATNLTVPWAMASLPSGPMLLTERSGRLSLLDKGKLQPIAQIPGVDHAQEHGLMGVAVSPAFHRDGLIFLSYTGRNERGQLRNFIVRYRLKDGRLSGRRVVVDDLPAADYHDGLPLRFGPEGKLYASTGDATDPDLAQDRESLAGKFLRMNLDGSVPADNPFGGSLVWSMGHRNCQGFDFHPQTGQLYAVEHGPTGGDELNLIEKGRNYGWPRHHHDDTAPPFVGPLRQWTPAIAPGGACFYDGDKVPAWRGRFFFAGLRGEGLYCVTLSKDDPRKVEAMSLVLHNELGRVRLVAQGSDGYLYIGTSNREGRAEPDATDDRLLRLVPAKESR